MGPGLGLGLGLGAGVGVGGEPLVHGVVLRLTGPKEQLFSSSVARLFANTSLTLHRVHDECAYVTLRDPAMTYPRALEAFHRTGFARPAASSGSAAGREPPPPCRIAVWDCSFRAGGVRTTG